MTRDDPPRLAGYRVLRRLGSGRRAEVHLGHAGDAADDTADRTVALKVFPAAGAETSGTDIAVLGTVTAVCIPRLLDVATLRDVGVCLVLERLEGPTLSGWLTAERRPHPGELVTVVGAVIGTVAAARAAGWTLGELVASSIRFDRVGRPVFTSFSGAQQLSRPDAADASARTAGDELRLELHQLGDFIADVLALARHADPGFLAWLRQQEATRPLTDRLPELEARVFDWAPARPVILGAVSAEAPSGVPLRLAPRNQDGTTIAHGETDDGDAASKPILRLLRGHVGSLHPARLRAGVGAFVGRHRRPTILAGVLVIGAAGAMLTLVPPAAAGDAPQPSADRAVSSSAAPTPPTTTDAAVPKSDPAIAADDPVAAASALLTARALCLRLEDADCLAAVDQAGSPIDEADRHALAVGDVPPSLPPADGIILTGRTGDAAMVSLPEATGETTPASLLLMKGEAGWRLREVFEG
ncbi:hypothetical protein [Leifsonia sp. Leaf264]|uniref:hypothetical protein n=1 Tax=Leifsonia sp. Leaf264 TaxID=1736314 RepID=UPI000A9C2455|nr:hypothetical protein [Leifsonia sp. Leaf264]